jgi:pyruvate dehydrogenase E2 component (dihydrolipoamide acetyltransferase)
VPIEVTMPKLSPTMETGVIVHWLVKVGDLVKEGDALAEIETDKATMPMKSYDDGTVVRIDHPAGDEVAVGQRVMVLAGKGKDAQAVAKALGGGTAKASTPKEQEQAVPAAAEPVDRAAGDGQHADKADNGKKAAGDDGRGPDARRLKVSPLARKLAESSGVDLSQVPGSGPAGRIIQRDVEAFVEQQAAGHAAPAKGTTAAPAEAARGESRPAPAGESETQPEAAGAATAPTQGAAPAPLADERIPHTRMRKTIAQRMVQAKQTAPEIHVTVDIRADRLVAVRERLNSQLAREGIKLSVSDFVTKAVALALRAHPGVNASFEADAIVRHGEVNLGIAVALPEGLIVPVLRRADTLGLREIRHQSEALAAAARANQLTGEQLAGGTFTISNLGMYGVRQFDAILNLPEAAILAVGAAEKRPVVEGDSLTVGTVMTVTLTSDHRAIDGALAAEFLRTLKALLEEPAAMLLG